MLQDEHGRPTQVHFAVIDSDKYSDQPNDIHNSKNIIIPLTVARRIEVLGAETMTADTKEIRVRIKAEKGFDPERDVDLNSLRFGTSDEVNYGRGSKVLHSEQDGKDLIVTFDGKGSGITAENFAGKLLGKTVAGKILYGWSRLPGAVASLPILSALSPKFEYNEDDCRALVQVAEAVSSLCSAHTVDDQRTCFPAHKDRSQDRPG
jgi:hypothetical protein